YLPVAATLSASSAAPVRAQHHTTYPPLRRSRAEDQHRRRAGPWCRVQPPQCPRARNPACRGAGCYSRRLAAGMATDLRRAVSTAAVDLAMKLRRRTTPPRRSTTEAQCCGSRKEEDQRRHRPVHAVLSRSRGARAAAAGSRPWLFFFFFFE